MISTFFWSIIIFQSEHILKHNCNDDLAKTEQSCGEQSVTVPERWETGPASPEDVNYILKEVGTNKDAEDVIIEMDLLLSCNIQGVNCAENQTCQEYQLQEVMDNDPKYWTMHPSSVKSF